MKHLSQLLLLIGIIFALAACSSGSSDGAPTASTAEAPQTTDTTASDTQTSDDEQVSGTSGQGVTVDGPNGYTLQVEEFADIVLWSYGSSDVNAKVCGYLDTDRNLHISRATISGTADVLCDGDGASILALEAGREIEQPDQDGSVVIAGGDNGTIVSGGDTFGKSDIGRVGVEVINPDDPAAAPATLYVEMVANSANITLTFAGTP